MGVSRKHKHGGNSCIIALLIKMYQCSILRLFKEDKPTIHPNILHKSTWGPVWPGDLSESLDHGSILSIGSTTDASVSLLSEVSKDLLNTARRQTAALTNWNIVYHSFSLCSSIMHRWDYFSFSISVDSEATSTSEQSSRRYNSIFYFYEMSADSRGILLLRLDCPWALKMTGYE